MHRVNISFFINMSNTIIDIVAVDIYAHIIKQTIIVIILITFFAFKNFLSKFDKMPIKIMKTPIITVIVVIVEHSI